MHAETSIPVSADAVAHSQRVSAFLQLQIENAGGWIPFSQWMHHALYAPGLGYYAAGSTKLAERPDVLARAPAGDFVTAPQLTSLFGYTLANQVAEILRQTGTLNVLEFGAGSGALAQDLLTALDTLGIRVQYQILEVSADLKARQKQLLAPWQGQVSWLDDRPAAFAGCVVANEVLDAMPAELFAWSHDHQVMQRGVRWDGRQFQWQDRPAAQVALALAEAAAARMPALPGYQSEINLQAEAWVRDLGTWLTHGAALLIDYGFPRHEFYHPQRHRGTMMCHIQHRAHDDAFLVPGLQDITTHVDFTAIADAALAGGMNVLGYTSQARFLINAGLPGQLERLTGQDARQTAQTQAAVHKLVSEAEMGELFKVMMIGRDVDPPLLGFAQGDRRGSL